MTVEEFWNSDEQSVVIYCNTREKAKRLLTRFHELGKTWLSGESYLADDKYEKGGRMTFYVNDGTYCDFYYVDSQDIQIIEFDDLEDFKEKN